MKGISYWFWVIGGVIAGLIIFSIAYQQIMETNRITAEQRSLEQFAEIKNIVNNLCWEFSGNKREYTLSLSEMVDGVYVTFDMYSEYDKNSLVENIISEKNMTGNFLCMKISDKRVKCNELECNATMPFMGSVPEEYSLSALINKLTGKAKTFDYYLEFEKKGEEVFVNLKE